MYVVGCVVIIVIPSLPCAHYSIPAMKRSPGSDIPAELVGYIVKRLLDPVSKQSELRGHKRSLSSCSLTCRYWSHIIRPVLFAELTLSAPVALAGLLAMLDSCTSFQPFLSQHVHEITIRHDPFPSPHWLHHVYKLSKRLCSARVSVLITRRSSAETSATTDRIPLSKVDLPFMLPKTLPASLYPFYRITLDNLRIRRRTDLLRFVRTIPELQHLECRRLRFDDGAYPFQTQRRNHHRTPTKVPQIIMSQCGDGHLETQMVLASGILASSEQFSLDGKQWATVIDVTTLSTPSIYSEVRMEIIGR